MERITFEERLYKHYIYTSSLFNICNDLAYDLKQRYFDINPHEYNSGKFYTFDIINYDETFEEVLQFLIQEYDPNYYKDLGYNIEGNLIDFYIII